MGLFNKSSKPNPIAEALEDLTKVFTAINSPDHPSFDELNEYPNVLNLLRLSKDWRDRSAKENAFGYAAVFSTIHWRTFLKSKVAYISGEMEFHEQLNTLGCMNLDFLYSDLKYIEIGVNRHGVSREELDECSEFISLYKMLVIDFIKEQERITNQNGLVAVSEFGSGKIALIQTQALISKLEPLF